MPVLDSKPTAELLLLLAHDPDDLTEAVAGLEPVDLAAPLRELPPDTAARVLSALPVDLAVAVLDEPELGDHRLELLRRVEDAKAAAFFTGLSADQQADVLGEPTRPTGNGSCASPTSGPGTTSPSSSATRPPRRAA